jgi:hypothetical protein
MSKLAREGARHACPSNSSPAPTASHLGKGEQEAVRADDAPQLLALDLRLVPAVMLDAEVHAAVEPLRSDLVRPLVGLSAVICLLDGRYPVLVRQPLQRGRGRATVFVVDGGLSPW